METNTKILIRNTDDKSRETWLDLPFSDEDFEIALRKIGSSSQLDENEMFDIIVSEKGFEGREEKIASGYEIVDMKSDLSEINDKTAQNDLSIDTIYDVNDIVEYIENLQPYEEESFNAMLEWGECSLEDIVNRINDGDAYFTSETTLAELAEQYAGEGYWSTDTLMRYIDFEKLAQEELGYCDTYIEINNGVLKTGE